MTVFQNIAFPLKLRRVARDEIERRVEESAAKAGLAVDLGRFPRELSGGERQRVALARALVREPEIILMDEALASLDAQLRSSLRVELKTFQRRLGRTFVYVTHDQAEALALADRLVVMRAGKVEQVGTPQEIFDLPQSEFVAAFVGNPPMNFFSAERAPQSGSLIVEGIDLKIKRPKAVLRKSGSGFGLSIWRWRKVMAALRSTSWSRASSFQARAMSCTQSWEIVRFALRCPDTLNPVRI
jgi:ABC-type sugar transport system ATPase subunit